ncbi:MAG: Asp-tRNA(Asn)/Glu-tRNA(Gln) amidotransferase subunit GatA [Oscillospiraceae bacterium]
MQLYNYTAVELSKMLKDKTISSKELTQSVIDRINHIEGKVGAYITLTLDEALQKAEKIDDMRAKGEELSQLAGIPIGIKDNICTKDVLTTSASKMLSNFVPPYDATVIQKLNDTVMMGKLNMDEFAMGSSCETSYFKKTHNPHNYDRVPGGSSGGSAAAVAAGEAIVSLGSDTGGSIRLPASYCGVVGLKPTYGTVSRYGLIAFGSSLDQIGPFGRCTSDVEMLYNSIKGIDKMDATTVSGSVSSQVKTIGIPKEYFGDGIEDETKKMIMDVAKILEKSGINIKEVSLPNAQNALPVYYVIASAEASSNLARFDGVKYGYRTENFKTLNELYENTRAEGFGEEVKRRILLGTYTLTSGHYEECFLKAKAMQAQIKMEFDEVFKECDLLLTPTSSGSAFKLGDKIDNPVKMYANDICTVTVNIAGVPAISVPCGLNKENMPIGAHFIGPNFSENRLFEISKKYEELSGIKGVVVGE